MRLAKYIRFSDQGGGVMAPGRASTNISKAYTSSAGIKAISRDEYVDRIEVRDHWVTLILFVRLGGKVQLDEAGNPQRAVRVIERTRVKDFEPDEELEIKETTASLEAAQEALRRQRETIQYELDKSNGEDPKKNETPDQSSSHDGQPAAVHAQSDRRRR